MEIPKPYFFIQSLFASFISIAPAISLFVYTATDTYVLPEGAEPDNDPMRAGWALLFLSPIIFLVLIIFFYSTSRILFSLKKLNLINHGLLALICGLILSSFIAYDSLKFFIMTTAMVTCWLSIGILAWHYLNKLRYNKIKNSRSLRSLGRAKNARLF